MIFPALFCNRVLRSRNVGVNLIKDSVKCVCHRLMNML